MGSNWRKPAAVAVWSPLMFGLISMAADRASAHFLQWPASLHLRNNVVAANFFFAAVASAVAGFLSGKGAEARAGRMVGFGLYAVVTYMAFMALTLQWME